MLIIFPSDTNLGLKYANIAISRKNTNHIAFCLKNVANLFSLILNYEASFLDSGIIPDA